MNAENCNSDEGCFCRKPIDAETYFDPPTRTTRWTSFKKWLGL
jgi:hypothetical protein